MAETTKLSKKLKAEIKGCCENGMLSEAELRGCLSGVASRAPKAVGTKIRKIVETPMSLEQLRAKAKKVK